MEADQNTKGHFFAMDEGVAGGDGGDAVVYCMGQGQSAAFEAQAREQVVGLHDPLQGWGGGAGFHRGAGGGPIGQQDVAAELGQGAASGAGQSPRTSRGWWL